MSGAHPSTQDNLTRVGISKKALDEDKGEGEVGVIHINMFFIINVGENDGRVSVKVLSISPSVISKKMVASGVLNKSQANLSLFRSINREIEVAVSELMECKSQLRVKDVPSTLASSDQQKSSDGCMKKQKQLFHSKGRG